MNSCKCVIFKDKNPENVGLYPIISFLFRLPMKSISLSLSLSLSLSSIKNNNKFKKLEIDIISSKDGKSTLGSLKKLNEEFYTKEKLRQEAEQNLINNKSEEKEVQQLEKNINNLNLMEISKQNY